MSRLASLLALVFTFTACGDGPEWTEAPGEPRVAPGTVPGADPGDDPLPVDDPGPPVQRDPGPVRAPDEGLELVTIWGEGLDVVVDELVWSGAGEIRFRMGLTESDSGKPAPAIGADHFGFAENGIKLGAEALFDVQRGKNLEVVLLLDLSHSIVEASALEAVKSGARALFDTLPREAHVALVGFSTEYELLVDFTDDPEVIHAAIDSLQPREGRAGRFTNLWGAVDFGAELFAARGEDTGRVMVVFTDGRDNVAEQDLPAAIDAVALAGARAFAIGLGDDFDAQGLERLVGPGRVSSTSEPAALDTLFRDIATHIGERLTVNYITPKASGTHTLAVTVTYGNRSGGFEVEFTLP